MSKRRQTLVTTACAIALASNSLTGFAQDRTAPQEPARVRTTAIAPSVAPPSSAVRVREAGATLVAGEPSYTITIGSDGQPLHAAQSVGSVLSPGQGSGTIGFMAAEAGFDSKIVKGVPFSAESISEFSQPLADGNRITRRSTTMLYRDSQGRTRREGNPAPLGLNEFVESEKLPKTVIITDPVEGTTYVLDQRARVARRSRATFARTGAVAGTLTAAGAPLPSTAAEADPANVKQIKVSGGVLQGSAINRVQPAYPPVAKAARASGAVQVQITVSEKGEVIEATIVAGHPLLREAALEAAKQWLFKPTELGGMPVKVQGILTFNFTLADESNKVTPETGVQQIARIGSLVPTRTHISSEKLAKQMIEGVECEGLRTVQTIPAGQIGNERPIEIVTERWYSPELQATVMTKQSDPRYGETVVRLTGIMRLEPDEYLFKVPAEFSIKDDIGYREMEMKVRRPEQQ
jgi:TonB family protein